MTKLWFYVNSVITLRARTRRPPYRIRSLGQGLPRHLQCEEMNHVNAWLESSLTQPSPVQKELADLIQNHATCIEYPAKKIFLEPGDAIHGVYYIAAGRTRHYMMAEDGSEKVLYTLAPGWFFGEASCVLEEPTSLYSMTEVKTQVYYIPLRDYRWMLDHDKLFREAILQSYSKKELILRHEVENLAFNSCKDRLKRLFCSVADTEHPTADGWYPLKVRYTQYELSAIVGNSRVTVNKLINELCEEGFIRLLNRKMQVCAEPYRKFTTRKKM